MKFKAWVKRTVEKLLPGKISRLYCKYEEALWYLFFGVMTTLVNYIVYLCMTRLVYGVDSSDIGGTVALVSNTVAWCVAVVAAFIFDRLWVFESKEKGLRILWQFGSFVGMRVLSGVVEVTLPSLAITYLSFNDLLAKVLVSVIVIMLNYLFSKFVSFRKKPEKTAEKNNENEQSEG